MLGKRYNNSPEVTLMNKQSRDKTKLVGTCGGCVLLGDSNGIPYCKKDLSTFGYRFQMGKRCDDYLHTR